VRNEKFGLKLLIVRILQPRVPKGSVLEAVTVGMLLVTWLLNHKTEQELCQN
jgi:hypothetical protein